MGHEAVIATALDEGLGALILVRDLPADDKNPLSAEVVADLWRKRYVDSDVIVSVVPNVVSVRYGRSVGYQLEEVDLSASVHAISGTAIREAVQQGSDTWKKCVHESIHDDVLFAFDGLS